MNQIEKINIPDTIPISMSNLINYLNDNFKIKIDINENFIKNTLCEQYSYHLYKKGKKKNNVKIIKKRYDKGSKKIEKSLSIEKDIYNNAHKKSITKSYYNQNSDINNMEKSNDITDIKNSAKCKRCIKNNIRYAIERIINIKLLANTKVLHNNFLVSKYNYHVLNYSFSNLLYNHQNICNLFKNIKFKLDNLYEILNKHEQNNKVIISEIDYKILLKNISKVIPTNDFIDMLIF